MTCLTGGLATSGLEVSFNEIGIARPMPLYQDLLPKSSQYRTR